MFTELELSGTPGTGQLGASPSYGAKVTGANSGAIGFVHNVGSQYVYLTNVSGIFTSGEKIKSTSCGASDELVDDNASAGSGTDLTISAVKTFDVSSVKQMYMDDTAVVFRFYCRLCSRSSRFTLTGTISLARGTDVLSGTNTLFNTELKAMMF